MTPHDSGPDWSRRRILASLLGVSAIAPESKGDTRIEGRLREEQHEEMVDQMAQVEERRAAAPPVHGVINARAGAGQSDCPGAANTRRPSTFPVEGVSIKVDGLPVSDADGNIILTNANGQFAIDVPIGAHSLRVEKTSHPFVNEGRFPVSMGTPNPPTHDFFEPINGHLR